MSNGLLRRVDAVQVPVPSLDEGIRFYVDGLGHRVMWRNDAVGQAGLGLPDGDSELVLTERLSYEPNWLVDDVRTAVATFTAAGGIHGSWRYRSESPGRHPGRPCRRRTGPVRQRLGTRRPLEGPLHSRQRSANSLSRPRSVCCLRLGVPRVTKVAGRCGLRWMVRIRLVRPRWPARKRGEHDGSVGDCVDTGAEHRL